MRYPSCQLTPAFKFAVAARGRAVGFVAAISALILAVAAVAWVVAVAT